jgi:superfamily II DNA or RNA helicase
MEYGALTVTDISLTETLIFGPETLRVWWEANRVPVPGAKYTPQFKRGRWDGLYSPGKWCRLRGDRWEWRGGRGLVDRILREVTGMAYHPGASSFDLQTEGLRDYQQEALQAIVHRTWCRIALATNAGKGAVIALAAEWAWREHRALVAILCDEISVWDALRDEMARWAPSLPVHRVGSGSTELPPMSGAALVMVPTLGRRLSGDDPRWLAWWRQVQMVLCDEADKATAATWRRVLAAAEGTRWRVGFSGTFPEEPHADLVLEEQLGPIAVRRGNMELVKRDISARPTVGLYRYDASSVLAPLPPDKKWWRGKMGPELRQWIFEQAIMCNAARHEFIAALIQPGVPTAVVVNRVQHGEYLAAAIPGAVFLEGADSAGHRETILADFIAGRLSVLVVTKILDRGTNKLGTAMDLIFASGEGSTRQTLQRIGRGLRRAGGKEFLRIIDIVDKGHVYLHAAVERRLSVYAKEEFDVVIAP